MPNIAAVPSSSTLKGDTQIQEPDRLAGAIARRAAEIRATVPDLELAIDVDAGPALALARGGGYSLTAILGRPRPRCGSCRGRTRPIETVISSATNVSTWASS
jgi:hypothetical protein